MTDTQKEKEFKPEDVIHFTLDRPPGSEWGKPAWLPVLDDIRALRLLEGNVATLAWRYAVPMVHAKVGIAKEGMYATQKELDDVRQVIENTPSDGLLVTGERVELKTIGVEGSALDIAPYLSYFENRVFTGLNVSQSMMGRGGAKQDADSMEEQVHNAVKDKQSAFSIQFQHEVITELLLEGGFNPILNEEDIVRMEFNEINLDTRVKKENHEVNLYQSNAITFEELRTALGYKSGDIDMSHLYANLISQKNTLEQIELNHENAMELAVLTAQLSSSSTDEDTSGNEDPESGNKNSYTKKNTGNGKTINTGKRNNTVKSTDSPSNQHGTYSARIKESETVFDALSDKIHTVDDLVKAQDMILVYINDLSKSGARMGAKKAMDDLFPDTVHDVPDNAPQNMILSTYIKKDLNTCF